VETRQFKYFNPSAFQYDLKMAFQGHYNLYNYTYPNHPWEVWKTIFLDIAKVNAPLRIRKVTSEQCPWMTNQIKSLAHHKFYLKQEAVKFNSTKLINVKRCRNDELNKRIKATKQLTKESKQLLLH
jgi:hypothetical protein